MQKPSRRKAGSRITAVLPEEVLDSNILITGPTLSEKDTIAFDLLADRWVSSHPPFVITGRTPQSSSDPDSPRSARRTDASRTSM